MRGVGRLPGVLAVGLDRREDVARFQRDDEIAVPLGLGDLDVAQGALDHGRRTGVAVLLDQLAFQAAGVDADAHRQSLFFGFADDLAVAIVAADVARVDADLVDGMIQCGQGHFVVEVDVADERNVDAPFDLAEHTRVFGSWHRDAHQFTAGLFQSEDLSHGGFQIVCLRRGHRLHNNRIVAADAQRTNADLTSFMALHGQAPGVGGR